MHRVWRDVARVGLQYIDGNLWIQIDQDPQVNLLGTGTFKIYAKEGEDVIQREEVQLDIEGPARVVYFTQDIPALTTIKIFDKHNTMRFHLVSEEDVEIQ